MLFEFKKNEIEFIRVQVNRLDP